MADPLNTPQFSFPFRVEGGQVACVEQDSDSEIYQNAEIVMRYQLGDRPNLPEFGIADSALREGGARAEEIAASVATWEPEATVELIQDILNEDGTQNLELRLTRKTDG